MKGFIVMIYIETHISECEGKKSMFQWSFFVNHKLMISCMIGLYVHKLLSLYNVCLETVHINNQMLLHFVNL